VGERSGIGVVECAVLEALDSLGASPGSRFRRSARVLAVVEDRIGLAPGYAYEVLLDLARPWTMPVTLVTGQGNLGSRGNDPAANFRYTECRLSPAGQVALAAERGELAPVPVGLINGNVYREGKRPPFRPQAIIEALRQVIQRPAITSDELTAIVGPPCSLNGYTVTGDFAALAAGRPAVLRLQARVTVSDDHRTVLITNLPSNPDDTAMSLANLATARHWARKHSELHVQATLPLADIRDESSRGIDLIVCTPERGTTAEQLRDQLMDVHGVYAEVHVALPRPLATMIREWAQAYRSEDLLASLTALENAIRAQPAAE
jgi:DNA gyrase/topoisomerase IV subunit A